MIARRRWATVFPSDNVTQSVQINIETSASTLAADSAGEQAARTGTAGFGMPAGVLEVIATGQPLSVCLDALKASFGMALDARAAVAFAPQWAGLLDHAEERAVALPFVASLTHAWAQTDEHSASSFAACASQRVICADVSADGRWPDPWRLGCLEAGVLAWFSTPVFDRQARPIGALFVAFAAPREPDGAALQMADYGAHLISILIERERSTAELRAARQEMAEELADTRLLHDISMRLAHTERAEDLFAEILHAAVTIMRSQFASIQLLHPRDEGPGSLELLASHGFDETASAFWKWVDIDSQSTCGAALRDGVRVCVPDVEACPDMAGTEDLQTYLHLGIRAVQTTPLQSRDGGIIGMISTHWSAVHAPTERELRLFDILVRQAADLVTQRINEQALRDADRRKDHFIAQLSHELRNPLAPIRNATRILEQQSGDAQAVRQAGSVIARNLGHFSRLIDDLMDVSRISRDRLELELRRVDLVPILQHAVETTRPAMEARRVDLHVSMPATRVDVIGDGVRLSQVFSNLLANAARYSYPGGDIRMELRQRPDRRIAVSVSDTGEGIAAEHIGRVFELYYQADSSPDNARGGLGIGLALARRLVELHHGTIGVVSAGPGKGSEFTVVLPAAGQAESTPLDDAAGADAGLPPPGDQYQTVVPLRILLADDNIDAAESMAALLRLDSHHVLLAHDGADALALAERHRPHVILLDLGMPTMTGYAVCEAIRTRDWGQSIRIAAVSGYGSQADKARTAAAGFDRHFVKPTDPQAILEYLESVHR